MRSPTQQEKNTKIKYCERCNSGMMLEWVGSTGWYHYQCTECPFEKSYHMHGRELIEPIRTPHPFQTQ